MALQEPPPRASRGGWELEVWQYSCPSRHSWGMTSLFLPPAYGSVVQEPSSSLWPRCQIPHPSWTGWFRSVLQLQGNSKSRELALPYHLFTQCLGEKTSCMGAGLPADSWLPPGEARSQSPDHRQRNSAGGLSLSGSDFSKFYRPLSIGIFLQTEV